jgi:hypothetical protein
MSRRHRDGVARQSRAAVSGVRRMGVNNIKRLKAKF